MVAAFVHCDENVVVQILVDDDFEYVPNVIDGEDAAVSLVLLAFLKTLASLAQVHFVPSLNGAMVHPEMMKNSKTFLLL